MGVQYLFSFVIITGIIFQSIQGNMCKQTTEPCVYNLLEFREREENYFLISLYTSTMSTQLKRHKYQRAHRATQSYPKQNSVSSFPVAWDQNIVQGLLIFNNLSSVFDLKAKPGKMFVFSHPNACRY